MRGWGPVVVAVALVGCGDGISLPDGGVLPDAGLGLVSLQFRSQNVGAGGHLVYFQNADSSLVLATRTDNLGHANAYMRPGGFVTVVVDRGSSVLFTHADVQPGDRLVIDEGTNGGALDLVEFTLRVPADPDATFYQLASTCGFHDIRGAELGPLLMVFEQCDPVVDLLVMAFSDRLRYLYREDVDLSLGAVALTGPYRDQETSTITATNVGAAVPQLFVVHTLTTRRRELYGQRSSLELVDGSATTEIPMVVPPDGTLLTRLDPGVFGERSTQHVIDWRPATTTTTIDYGAGTLRGYLEVPLYDERSSVLRWREDAAGEVGQAVVASFAWAGLDGQSRNWHVLAPRGEEPLVRLPVLPRADLRPASVVFFETFVSIALDGGYPAVRGKLLGGWPDRGLPWPVEGEAGRVVYRQLNSNQF